MRANGKEEEKVRESERECAREWMQERWMQENGRAQLPAGISQRVSRAGYISIVLIIYCNLLIL